MFPSSCKTESTPLQAWFRPSKDPETKIKAKTHKGKNFLYDLGCSSPGNLSEILKDLKESIFTISDILKELSILQCKYDTQILEIQQDGKGWIERKYAYKKDKFSCPTFETTWSQFRQDTVTTFQKCVNSVFERWEILPIKWDKYGTESPFSDIDLVATSENNEHSYGELFFATLLVNIFSSYLFAPSADGKLYRPTTGYLFDWETYTPHHGDLFSERSFHTKTGKMYFRLFGLQLAIMQVHKNCDETKWGHIKRAILQRVETRYKSLIAEMMEDIELFRKKQFEEDEFKCVHLKDALKVFSHQNWAQIKRLAKSALKIQEIQITIQSLEKKLIYVLESEPREEFRSFSTHKALSTRIDKLRLRMLLYHVMIESLQEGGQYSYGTFEVICKNWGGQLHKRSVSLEVEGIKEAADKESPLHAIVFHSYKIFEKHPISSDWQHVLSALENFGFLCGQNDLIEGSKYLERIYQSLAEVRKNLPSINGNRIFALHEVSLAFLSAKRNVELYSGFIRPFLKMISVEQSALNKKICAHLPEKKPIDSRKWCSDLKIEDLLIKYLDEAIKSSASSEYYISWNRAVDDKGDATASECLRGTIMTRIMGKNWQEMIQVIKDEFFSDKKLTGDEIEAIASKLTLIKKEAQFFMNKSNAAMAAMSCLNRYRLWSFNPRVIEMVEGFFLKKGEHSPKTEQLIQQSQEKIKKKSQQLQFNLIRDLAFDDLFKVFNRVVLIKLGEMRGVSLKNELTATWCSLH